MRRISRRRRIARGDGGRVCSVVEEQKRAQSLTLLSREDGVGKPLLGLVIFNFFLSFFL